MATNAADNSTALALPLTIAPAANTPVVTSAQVAEGAIDAASSYQIEASNDPVSYVVAGPPKGLALDSTSGLISGTPKT